MYRRVSRGFDGFDRDVTISIRLTCYSNNSIMLQFLNDVLNKVKSVLSNDYVVVNEINNGNYIYIYIVPKQLTNFTELKQKLLLELTQNQNQTNQ